jgi:hypothetical protein
VVYLQIHSDAGERYKIPVFIINHSSAMPIRIN